MRRLKNTVKLFVLCFMFCMAIHSLKPDSYNESHALAVNTGSLVKPIFVIKTFYYPNSKTFTGSDAVVTLFNGESYAYENYTYQCWRMMKDGTIERSLGRVIDLAVSPRVCKVGVMRLTCEFPVNGAEMLFYSVGVTGSDGKTEYQRLTVTKPNKKPYKFVSCMSRMLAVDDWAKFIIAMETFRYYGGDLAVTAVECAIKQVMDLARLYEKDGILKIQNAFKPKPIPELNYDPLLFTEYANQISNAHECFYEFRESAEFISFPDWDDVLTGHPQNTGPLTYYDMFSPLIQSQPKAASYSLDRFETTFLTQIHEAEEFSLANVIRKVKIDRKSVLPKIVIRPHLVASVWIHSAKIFDGPYGEEKTKAAAFAHIHCNISTKDKPVSHVNRGSNDTFADPDLLGSNFQNMLDRYSFKFETSNYPFASTFYNIIRKCYQKIGNDFKKNGEPFYCPTTAACKFDAQNVTVVKTKTTYKETVASGPFVWVERDNVEFVTDNNGCL